MPSGASRRVQQRVRIDGRDIALELLMYIENQLRPFFEDQYDKLEFRPKETTNIKIDKYRVLGAVRDGLHRLQDQAGARGGVGRNGLAERGGDELRRDVLRSQLQAQPRQKRAKGD